MTTFISLDIGTHLGYCIFVDTNLRARGAVKLPDNPIKSATKLQRRYLKIKALLAETKQNYPELSEVLYEQTDWHIPGKPAEPFRARLIREYRNRTVQRSMGRIEGMIESATVETGLVVIPVSVTDAKKSLTGNGRATKEQVSVAVLALYPEMSGESQDTLDSVSVAAWKLAQIDKMWRSKLTDSALVRSRKASKD